MPKGISLHIGLNRVDPRRYGGWDGRLAGCINDAKDMQAIATSLGYTSTLLTDEKATARAVTGAIKKTAAKLEAGDSFFLTYSGHGGQVPDVNGDEAIRDEGEIGGQEDEYDETWVLYDRQLIDDELWALWSHFPARSRITVFSDSCHSGTVSREPAFLRDGTEPATSRRMPLDVEERDYKQHKASYDRIQATVPPREASDVKATVALISGCMDNQTSADGQGNGLFTSRLLQVWDGGAFRGSLSTLRSRTAALMPRDQTPNFYVVGARNAAFLRRRALAI
jgi:metacaspase-1